MIPTIDTTKIGEWVIRLLISISVVSIAFALIPPVALPDEIAGAVEWVVQSLVNFGFLVPLSTIFPVLGLVFLTEFILISIRLVLWLNHHFNKNNS